MWLAPRTQDRRTCPWGPLAIQKPKHREGEADRWARSTGAFPLRWAGARRARVSRGDLRDTHTCTHMRTHIACIHTLPHPHRHVRTTQSTQIHGHNHTHRHTQASPSGKHQPVAGKQVVMVTGAPPPSGKTAMPMGQSSPRCETLASPATSPALPGAAKL